MSLTRVNKNEKIKTTYRRLKKRKNQQLSKLCFNAVVNLFYMRYTTLFIFLKLQKLSINSNVLRCLLLEESGTTSIFNYWLKSYRLKKY
uniref:Ribosomal protein L20 n=1 Tax=Balbiania investiens TaxID=111861 RepID=A0A4D6BLM6_9FLOR